MGDLSGYEKDTFTFAGKTRDVYRKGEGPAVLVFAEMPGITPKVIDFADRVVALGCTAVVPHLFGEPGADVSVVKALRAIAPACVSKEFSAWATGKTSPVVEWSKALARHEHERRGGPGVGVVGMCFTGNFALAMLPEPAVLAPVLSQPSLPLGFSKKARRALYLSDADLRKVQDRLAAEP
jgi:dienelactone hydrolase